MLPAGRPRDHDLPGPQSLYEIASAVGARVERWTPEETERGFWFDPARLGELAREGARAIVVNFPHNPTGALPTPVEWAAVVDTAERAGATLVSDEMYRGLEYAVTPLTPGAVASERGVSVGGLSKAYGLPGLRAGWLATRDRALLESVQAYKDYTTICASARATARRDRAQSSARLVSAAAVSSRRTVPTPGFVARHPGHFAWRRPDAGPITFARFLRAGRSRSARGWRPTAAPCCCQHRLRVGRLPSASAWPHDFPTRLDALGNT
jgi:aspartate/methionine/tyrosine aminotransferase